MKYIDEEMRDIALFTPKQTLASQYLPDLSPRSAVNRLMQWIGYNRDLTDALLATGYNKLQKQFTREQVRLIYDYLGEP